MFERQIIMAVTFQLAHHSAPLLFLSVYIASILQITEEKVSLKDYVEMQVTRAEAIQTGCTRNYNNGSWGPCPPWSICDEQKCTCRMQTLGYIQCGRNVTKLQSCHCLTFDHENVQFKLGKCLYSCGNKGSAVINKLYFTVTNGALKFNLEMCGYLNRTGTLCGQCLPNHWPQAYSYQMNCIKCPNSQRNWWKYVLAAFGPVTILYLLVLIFKASITQPHVFSFVFYAQVVSTPYFIRGAILSFSRVKHHNAYIWYLKVIYSIYGIFSLDFFRSFDNQICLELDILQIHVLEYCIALYPLCLIFLTYVLIKLHNNFCCIAYAWKPFRSLISALDRHSDNTRSLIDAYTVFFILSITKIICVSVDLLLPVEVHVLNANGTESHYLALYLDGSKRYMGADHLPYGILALVVLFVFIVLPTLVLFLYPFQFFQVFLNSLPQSITISLHHFVEKFQGYYKNGTGGTRDYRFFSVLYIVLIIVLFGVYALTLDGTYFVFSCVFLIVAASLYPFFQPYREMHSHYTKISFGFLFLIVIQYLCITEALIENYTSRADNFGWMLAFGISLIPLGYICVISTCNLLKLTACGRKLLQCYQTWKLGMSRHGYTPLHGTAQ